MYSKKRGVVLLRIIKARFQAVSKISTEKALFIEELFPAETKEFLQREACCCRIFWKNINQIFLLRDHLGIDIRCFSHIWTNIFMHFHMMNKRNSISTYFIYRNIYFFLNSISNSFWIFFKFHRFIIFLKRITISKKSSSSWIYF